MASGGCFPSRMKKGSAPFEILVNPTDIPSLFDHHLPDFSFVKNNYTLRILSAFTRIRCFFFVPLVLAATNSLI